MEAEETIYETQGASLIELSAEVRLLRRQALRAAEHSKKLDAPP